MASFIFTRLAIAAALAAGVAAGYMYRKNVQEKKIGRTEEYARNLLDDAQRRAEEKKKESILEAKEEVIRLKNELDREIRDRRAEVQRSERRVTQREETLDKKADNLDARETGLERKQNELDRLTAEAQEYSVRQKNAAEEAEKTAKDMEEKSRAELERVAKMTQDEARDMIVQRIQKEAYHDAGVMVREIEQTAKDEAEKKARNIVAMAIQRCASDHVAETTVSVVSLPNEDMKGRIIGREGRNIRTLETATGVDLIIDDTPEAVIVSAFDPIRREVARIALEKLIADGRIHPARIEEMVEKAKREVDNQIREAGEQAIFETNMHGIHHELVKLLGRMRYRTSYGQNVLQHSIEVSHLAGLMAAELGADVQLAKRAGLLHDIGKAVDHEMEGTHVELGVEMAKRPPRSSTASRRTTTISSRRPSRRCSSRRPTRFPRLVRARAVRASRTTSAASKSWRKFPTASQAWKSRSRFSPAARCASWSSRRTSPTRAPMCSPARSPSALKMSWNIRDRSRSTSSARPAAPSSRSETESRRKTE